MSKKLDNHAIRLRGVRHNNLKNFDLDLPLGKLIVVTGLSGSGKSSLAFDTLYAEGQRRYIETFSPYARQFFDRMDKPQVDSIQGIPPAIALEQRNSVKSTRSTVGTMTEVCDYMKLLWPHIASLYCRGCGKAVRRDSPQGIWEEAAGSGREEALVAFDLPLSEKLSPEETLGLIAKQGYQRILWPDASKEQGWQVVRVEEAAKVLGKKRPAALTVLQDKVRLQEGSRPRFVEACEQAYHFGKGKLSVCFAGTAEVWRRSKGYHCAACDIEYKEPSPALFSFNNPVGACAACRGFGRTITIDYNLAMPDRSLSIAGGVVKPWQTETGAESQEDLLSVCRQRGIPTKVPFEELEKKWQDLLVEGDPGYGENGVEWPRAWYGLKGYFRYLESKSYKMHIRVLLARYRAYVPCPECGGKRFNKDSLLFKIADGNGGLMTLSEFYLMPIDRAVDFAERMSSAKKGRKASDPFVLALGEVGARLKYLKEVGLGYLTLDRSMRSLSGGETERVNLTTCLGSRLVNTLFVLDEPSVGLHARDTERLVGILQRLRDTGNTIVVVEHESSVMRAADQIVDIGPGHGETGGQVVFQGTYGGILKHAGSLTGKYLVGTATAEVRRGRPVGPGQVSFLRMERATLHNLKEVAVEIPLSRFVCVTGVSGSGKSTLARDLLYPALVAKLGRAESGGGGEEAEGEEEETEGAGALSVRISGYEGLGRAIMVDQSSLGRTPRSNPAVYIGAFDDIREVFGQSEEASQKGLGSGAFSFNSAQGQCERCRGAGHEKIEMQFLSDIFIRCPDCDGKRYRPHILEVKIAPGKAAEGWSIADVLRATVEDAIAFFGKFEGSRPARKAVARLKLLEEVGLGYLRLGQPINTLSGGESQRLKLVRHLSDFSAEKGGAGKPCLFVFDEPTTGLHFDDVRILLKALHRIVDEGHSVLVVEHNLDVIRSADWVIDMGPEGGEAGGKLVAAGPPEAIERCAESLTGKCLRKR